MESFDFDVPKTKNFANVLSGLGVETGKSLFVMEGSSKNVALSSRNIKGTMVSNVNALSTYDMMRADKLILQEEAVGVINEILNN